MQQKLDNADIHSGRHSVSTEQCMFIKRSSTRDSEFVRQIAYFNERIYQRVIILLIYS